MFGQIPDFGNSFEFLRKLWATGSGMPGGLMPGLSAMTPPMDLDEVDKRIRDLKAVESWLQLNTNLLRTTIQGLEVQRATLVALQTFGNALSPEAMQNAMENVARAANAPSAHPPQHTHHFDTAQTVSQEQADAENDEADDDADAPPEVSAEDAEGDESTDAGERGPAPLPPNASLWWDLLQRQFSQIASGAAAASAAAASTAPFGGMAGFGTAAAPGAEGVEPEAKGEPPARKAAPNGKARPATRKSAAKPPATKNAAAKNTPVKKASTKASSKDSAKKAPARRAAAKTGSAIETQTPGTPEDTSE